MLIKSFETYPQPKKCFNGTIKYYKKGKLHREDGPAVILNNGHKYYYLFGNLVDEKAVMNYKYTIGNFYED